MPDYTDIVFRDIVREELEDVWEASEEIIEEHFGVDPGFPELNNMNDIQNPIIEFNSNIGFMVLFPIAMFNHELCQCEECINGDRS